MTGIPLAAVELWLDSRGLKDAYPDTVRVRGLGDAADLKAGAGRMLILTRSGGPGLTMDWAIDQPIVSLRCVGRQRDPEDAQLFADAVDAMMLTGSSVTVGSLRVLYVARTGGAPTHITTDRSRRAHYSCSYVIPVASGL